MGNVAELAFIAFFVRLVGAVFFSMVLYKQIKLRRSNFKDGLNSLRNTLIALAFIPYVYNFVALLNNYYRMVDGHTNQFINNISFPFSAIASTSTAVLLWAIYSANSSD